VTATTVLAPLGCPPPWAVSAARQAAAARAAAPARTRTLTVPLVASGEWFWELVGSDEVEDVRAATVTEDAWAWGLVAAPALLLLQVVATDLLRLVVPTPVLALELLLAFLALAYADAARLRAAGLRSPSPWAGVVPPVYLFQRYAVTRDPRVPLAWMGVAAAATLLSVAVDARLAPVTLPSDRVETRLYEQLFAGDLPLDTSSATISCPAFSRRWVGQDFRCTGTDRNGSVPLEVSVLDRSGALATQPLQAAP
jgi:hypothetical protein